MQKTVGNPSISFSYSTAILDKQEPRALIVIKRLDDAMNPDLKMSLAFVHLSDIHFGQERGGAVVVNNDVKQRLIDDVRNVCGALSGGRAAGLIVSGDVAYGGTEEEYHQAAVWLDEVTQAAGCAITDIQVVPGNHDVDRREITAATDLMIANIREKGQVSLDRFLAADIDRELLYRRFRWYRPFAEAYRCPLDTNGTFSEERVAVLAPGRSIRFIRINSALICSTADEEGKLILGAGQRVLPERSGEEIVVLCHHPLHWFQDSEDAKKFVRSRARVFISGHEHNPSVRLEPVEKGCDLLMLAAGATVPPTADEEFTYTYNVLEFDWCAEHDALQVTVHPRAWDDDRKCFTADDIRLGGADPSFTLACPNFAKAPRPAADEEFGGEEKTFVETVQVPADEGQLHEEATSSMVDNYSLLLLRFFRDLSAGDRLTILVKLGALPDDWADPITQPIERRAFESLIKSGKAEALSEAINGILATSNKGI